MYVKKNITSILIKALISIKQTFRLYSRLSKCLKTKSSKTFFEGLLYGILEPFQVLIDYLE
jgi:hypothetical protein